jgi:uncharacterized membrane protein YcgQ (UPF0703/DUF1980 family)
MNQNRQIPVFLFTGFLDAGKTRFIQETLENKEFTKDRRTLLLMCEEGEEEYCPERFGSENVFCEVIENEDDLSGALLLSLASKHDVDQIMVEYNGMWALDSLYTSLVPPMAVAQEFAFFDYNTILTYNANMRTQVVDKLRSADLAIFNRVPKGADIMPYHKLVRGVSRQTDIVYDHSDGTIERDEIIDPMPFDKNAPIIEIEDKDYALFYRDLGENLQEYEGKVIKFRGMVARNEKLAKDELALGRQIMVCCADDVAYSGIVAEHKGAEHYKEGEWLMVTAKIALKKHVLYQSKGPILKVESLAHTDAPKEEIATFY